MQKSKFKKKIAQRLIANVRSMSANPKKKYSIERLKALGATSFEGTTDLADTEAWLNQIEKCFRVMRCLDDRKIELAAFLLQKEPKNGGH